MLRFAYTLIHTRLKFLWPILYRINKWQHYLLTLRNQCLLYDVPRGNQMKPSIRPEFPLTAVANNRLLLDYGSLNCRLSYIVWEDMKVQWWIQVTTIDNTAYYCIAT